MPDMSFMTKADLSLLAYEYNALPWYKQLFYPGALGTALGKYNTEGSLENASAVCRAFLNTKTWFFQRWFFPSLSFFARTNFSYALRILNNAGLLTGDDNFSAVAGHQNPRDVASALRELKDVGLLSEANRNAVAGHQNPRDVASALGKLKDVGLLSQANRNAVAGHKDPESVASAFRELKDVGLLSETNRNAVARHQAPMYIANALGTLNTAGLLTGKEGPYNFNAVARHQASMNIALALSTLNTAGLLTGQAGQANFNAVARHQAPMNIALALSTLNTADLLTGEAGQANRNAVSRHQYPMLVAEALCILNTAGLLSETNRNAVARHQAPRYIANALGTLNTAGLLTGQAGQANFIAVIEYENLRSLVIALVELKDAGLLTGQAGQANFKAVTRHQNLLLLVAALQTLNTAGLLTGEAGEANFNAVVGHQSRFPWAIFPALRKLNTAGLLTGEAGQANFSAVAAQQEPGGVAEALRTLNTADLLTGEAGQANRNAVSRHEYPMLVAEALCILNTAGLLTGEASQANRNTVAVHEQTRSVVYAIEALNAAHLLTQDRFNFVAITYTNILCYPDAARLWTSLAAHHLTQAHFTRIIDICEANRENLAQARRLFITYVQHNMLGINRPAAGAALDFNGRQSTHTASVHKAVSTAATNLMNRYGSQISGANLDKTITELSTWLDVKGRVSPKMMAAKRCLQRLIAPDYFFTDPESNVSTKQLLALIWLAFHDESQRMGCLADAKDRLIEGLYEAQRGYNLSESGVDNNNPEDISICVAGTFNKIIEKGCGIHPDIELQYITREGASLKFPIVVNEAAMAYLRGLADADTRDLLNLMEKIKAKNNHNTVEPIWGDISSEVATKMFDEFGSAFQGNKSSADFQDLINAGEYVSLTESNREALEALIPKGRAASPRNGFFASGRPVDIEDNAASARPGPKMTEKNIC